MAKVSIGVEFVRLRKMFMLTQQDLAVEMGMSLRAIQWIEHGISSPTIKTKKAFYSVRRKYLRKTAHALKVRNQQLAEIERSHAGK